jgi:hypothetical protein
MSYIRKDIPAILRVGYTMDVVALDLLICVSNAYWTQGCFGSGRGLGHIYGLTILFISLTSRIYISFQNSILTQDNSCT